ncbi:mycofactocin system transcriptional regulator [Agrococcus sp. SCSIO52902]|uniref:mycofactocin system transcriptional regulator n=1 Tax=Agrococcus sp. SCSIO52902 TaxID=2933290 RepID=UPI001FF283AE|nr:mycofactocin system transcriptional regulator [Agrococcus sp. SCSIO52902]UOW00265.1 mycofactocin system transcriptional regulator [Agrococcus sp. SCSIO52902]
MTPSQAGAPPPRARPGRTPSTSREQISHVALELFMQRGFDGTTVDDIARAAAIGRRTFFRYFSSKNDVPWGDFDSLLERMRAHLASLPDTMPLMEQLRRSVMEFNRVGKVESQYHRRRMELLLNVPTLVAHSTLRYRAWREVIADHVARRLNVPSADLIPQTIAWTCLGACLAAYEQWLADRQRSLPDLLDEALLMIDVRIDAEGMQTPRGTQV